MEKDFIKQNKVSRKTYFLSCFLVFICIFILNNCISEENFNNKKVVKPNIVFLFSDDQSMPDLGAYGNSAIHTPNLDLMAEEGIKFNRAYVPTSQCSPTRAAILTGRSPHEVGASRLHGNVPHEVTSLIELLNREGYFTGAYRKVHQDNIQSQFNFYGDRNKALPSFFDELPNDTPFFLWFGSRDPHRPYNADNYDYLHDPDEVIIPDYLPDTDAVRKDIANYYNEITRFDRESGEIMKLLEEHGLSENTMVVMSSDNGMPFPRAKATLYEAGIHVPLLIKWPGQIEGGEASDELVTLTDLTPTWLEAAGIPVPAEMGGQSLIPLLKGDQKETREYIFAERNWHDNWDPMRAVVAKRYKLIQNYRPGVKTLHTLDRLYSPTWDEFERLHNESNLNDQLQWYFASSKPPVEFYDLENDPGEWNNLATNSKYDSLITQYQQVLGEWMNQTHDFLPAPLASFPQGSRYNGEYDVLNAEEF